MRPCIKPLAMGSAALVGASMIAAAPSTLALTPPLPEHAKAQLSDVAVRLAANSIANIPVNLFRILADIPINQLDGLNAASESLEGSGNWWLYTPTNALGWDHMDYAKAIGFTKMLMPIPEVAQAQADQINATMARNFPMTRSCTGIPGPCADPYYFTAYFSTPPLEALFGYSYTFGDVFNSVDQSIEMPWSNQTLTYDPFGAGKALWEALTKDPEEDWEYQPTFWQERQEASQRFWKAVFNSFNPFVEGTYCVPCQFLGVKGAPSSLPVANIFGNIYTYFDLGQEFTDQDWSQPHPEMPAAPSLKTLPLFSAEAWQRINSDAKVYFNWVFKGGPVPQSEMEPPHNWPAVPDTEAPVSETLADSTLLASTEESDVQADETTKVTETVQRRTNSLFTLNLGAAKKAPKLAAGEVTTATEVTPVTGGEESQPSTNPGEAETEAGATDGTQAEANPSPRKRFTDAFEPRGSSKQRANAEAKKTERAEAAAARKAERAEAAASKNSEAADDASKKSDSDSDDSKKDAA